MTRQFLLFIGLTFIVMACTSNRDEVSRLQVVNDYISAINHSDLNAAAGFISDSIIISESEFIQTQTKNEWFTQLRWDSVFSPHYEIIEMTEVDGSVDATISQECKRIRFLHDSATTYKARFDFSEDKINRIHVYEYLVFDFGKWQPRRDTLVSWIDKNHPELNGFIYDQTKEGAENYLMAIDLYLKEQ